MRRSKPDLSHWINYLISQKNIGFTIGVMLISAILVIFGFIIGYEEKISVTLTYTLLVIDSLLLVIFFLSLKFKLSKASKLLKKVMKGEILDPEKIREEWFGKGKKK